MKRKNIYICFILIIIIFICTLIFNDKREIRSIKSERELLNIYESDSYDSLSFAEKILTLPFSIFTINYYNTYSRGYKYNIDYATVDDVAETSSVQKNATSSKDYSETNIQVEGVDEADIIKTDGNYIYSISDNKVIITNVEDPEDIKIESTIYEDNSIPMDLLLYNNYLIIISYSNNSNSNWYNYNNQDTNVNIYNIENKDKPKLKKSFKLNEAYNTTRCIDGKLYVFSKGYLRKENDKIEREYIEDNKTKEIKLNDIKYLKDNKNNIQTLIAEFDLNKIDSNIRLSSYLIDISDAYVSKDNIYLVNENYYSSGPSIKDLFGLKGVIGLFISSNYDYSRKTSIYKFEINKNKGVVYLANTKVEGNIVNQYSLDEKDGNLRIALQSNDGTRILVLDKKLKKVGETENVARGERMYASRFMNDKAYLVTFKNTDPLFVIDLSDPVNPKVLGELKIPGYSTYLHPYDDTHLIGIGMDTEEVVNRDLSGNITSSWTEITGMKMSLFDVSDLNNPVQIDSVKIGDRRTVSAILTNPKALLFSKEKELLAIPVNNYNEDFSTENSTDYEEEIENYTSKCDNYISEGYFVYNITLDGFKLKGTITHDKTQNESNRYYYYYKSRLLRGIYIENNLYTVSEDYIKINNIENLEQINSLKLKGEA